MDLHGPSILLTGGGSSIGRSLALELADRRGRLALVGRRPGPLEEVSEQVRSRGSEAHVVQADLTASGSPAPVLLTRAALPAVRASGASLVVVVSSAMALVGCRSTPPTRHQGRRRPRVRLRGPDQVAAAVLTAIAEGQVSFCAVVLNAPP